MPTRISGTTSLPPVSTQPPAPVAGAPNPVAPTAPAAATGFTAAPGTAPVAGVTAEAPPPPLPPLVGEAWENTTFVGKGYGGTIFDATLYLQHHLGLKSGGELRLFHHAASTWGTPDDRDTWVSTKRSGGAFGKGFYSSTRPETGYGPKQFQLALPVEAFAGKKVLECKGFIDREPMVLPPGVDVLVGRPSFLPDGERWFIFKPGSETWLNDASTESNFDGPGKTVAWD